MFGMPDDFYPESGGVSARPIALMLASAARNLSPQSSLPILGDLNPSSKRVIGHSLVVQNGNIIANSTNTYGAVGIPAYLAGSGLFLAN
jgi:hypothetical protein